MQKNKYLNYITLINRLFVAFLLFSVCGGVVAQSRPDIPVVFYNSGPLSVKNNAIMYIGGSLSATSNNTQKSEILVDNAKIVLTGHFLNNVKSGTVFVKPAGTVHGTVEFKGTLQQWITTDGTTYDNSPSKTDNYIDFPHIIINNASHVMITPEMAAKTENINLEKGWLIVDSRKAIADKDYASAETQNLSNHSVFAHLLVNGNKVDYKNWSATDVNERGFVQVNMALANEGANIVNGKPVTSLVGFGSPFAELRADYFMFNNLVQPDHNGFFGASGKPNRYPENYLHAGRGNVLTIDLLGSDYLEYSYSSPFGDESNFDNRVSDGSYHFNRHKFADPVASEGRNINNVFGNDATQDAFANEILNIESITIPLKAGYNYLSNPYLTPLNIATLMQNSASNNWGVIVDDGIIGNGDIYNAVWIMNPDSKVEYLGMDVNGKQLAQYYYHYYVAQNPGGTYMEEKLAPLQMFVVWAEKDGTITIPKEERVMGNTKFIRSAEKSTRKDDFIIEVTDHTTHTSDRTNFVLRPSVEIKSTYADKNIIRESSVYSDADGNNPASDLLSLASRLSTKDATGNDLLVNFLPLETTYYVPLYIKPSTVEQEISLRGLRMNSLTEIDGMWLEDKREQTITPFTAEEGYDTNTLPTDREDRFVIHLKKPLYDNSGNSSTIDGYYRDGIIHVEGFGKNDLGSTIHLYNINGMLLAKTTAEEYHVTMNGSYSPGVYLLRVGVKPLQTIKLLIH